MTTPTALLVEDDGAIRDALCELLESTGYRVTRVSSAEQGIFFLRNQTFSVLVTDCALPGESGEWLVRQARAEGLLDETRVLVVTALLKPPEIDGVSIHPKPLDIDQFLGALPAHNAATTKRASRMMGSSSSSSA
jgi:DNA-binding response OmpR family regulator